MSKTTTMQKVAKLLEIFSAGCIIFGASAQVSNAFSLATLNDWNYAIDSFNDSITGNDVGGTKYEIYGMAMTQIEDKVIFAVNSNLPLEGTSSNYAEDDNHVGWGDLLLNFSNQNLTTASNNSDLFAIDFTGSDIGVYSNVSAKNIAKENGNALDSLYQYNQWVEGKLKNKPNNIGTPSNGDLGAYNPYFDQNQHVLNVRKSGTRIGDVNILEGENLGFLGLNFSQFNRDKELILSVLALINLCYPMVVLLHI